MNDGGDAMAVTDARRSRQPVLGFRLQRPGWRGLFRGVLIVMVLAIAIAALGAAYFAPHAYDRTNLSAADLSPNWFGGQYFFGTDQLGRDMLSRLLFGLRTSVLVGLSAVVISGIIGVVLGLISGYAGSYADSVIMRAVDMQMSIPPVVLLLFLAFLLGPGLRTTILILGVIGWLSYARMVRAEVLVVKELQFVEAARAIGCSPVRVAVRHALPQVLSSIIVLATLQFGAAIIAEASISFVGFGIQPPGSSLGLMIADGRTSLSTSPWIAFVPVIAMFVLVLLVNLLGDELQEMLDPVKKRAKA